MDWRLRDNKLFRDPVNLMTQDSDFELHIWRLLANNPRQIIYIYIFEDILVHKEHLMYFRGK